MVVCHRSRNGPLRRGSKSNPLRGDGGYLPGQIGRDLVDGSSRNPEPLVARDRNIPLNRLASDASGQKPQKPRIRGEKTKERDGFVALTETEKIVLSVKRQRLESRSSDARRGQAREDESPPIDAHGQVATAGAPFDELGLPSAPPVRIRAEKTRQATPEAAEARKYATENILLLFAFHNLHVSFFLVEYEVEGFLVILSVVTLVFSGHPHTFMLGWLMVD